ncbi:MAG: hypothetical protein VX367_07765 [SAR324 cluster bacterium]|nr:hypothetical protein [SAR324 cluster bacterium]
MRVGRGSNDEGLLKHLGRSSDAKTACNTEKANADRRTDGPTDIAGCRVACTRLKSFLFKIRFDMALFQRVLSAVK